ncbi:MAG: Tn3 family transposase [Nostoc sp. NMS8]|nr:Tn3 family transposase [Nostoc sp. NMS8]
MSEIEIIKAFAGLEDPRCRAGQRHNLPLSLALFTLVGAARRRHRSREQKIFSNWVSDWYVRDETYSKALAEVVNFHAQIPFAAYWGDGTTSLTEKSTVYSNFQVNRPQWLNQPKASSSVI